MRLIHNSRLPQFRTPFGAVTTGTSVSLSVILEDADPNQATLTLRTWVDEIGESRYPMTHEGDGIFTVELECAEPCLIWYSFICNIEGQPEVRLGAPQGRTGGEGITYDYAEVPSFQVTVYKHREVRPEWYERGMVYQIFPDRYARDEHWRERTLAEVEKPRNGIQRRMVEDWNEPPVYERAEDGSIKTWDFYCGSLKGIQEDLPRIAELGFTAIYLNPIFEAASNHRYDTADYTKIDPILGTEQDFTELCEAAEKLGISIILDGVFNHTGDDSIYFNRYGNYPGVGAWQSEDSPWRDAFYFHEDGSYDCWWGVGNMPAINESSELVRERLLGKDGVIRKWLRAGAHGWRLDVADELSDDFLAEIKKAVLAEKPDALLLGEVWEDASNKRAYGVSRRYFVDGELDSVMNYPWRNAIVAFLTDADDGTALGESLMTLAENYPPEVLSCVMNHLGTHDTPRILTVLGEPFRGTKDERAHRRMTPVQRKTALMRLRMAVFLQFTLPGMPCIYYGDEAGMEGFEDPFCRACYPWGREDEELQAYYRMMTALRGSSEALRRGGLRVLAAGNGRIAFTRAFGDESLIVCVNHSIGEWVLPAGRVRFAESAAPSPTGEVVLMRGGFCLLEPSDPEAHISIE